MLLYSRQENLSSTYRQSMDATCPTFAGFGSPVVPVGSRPHRDWDCAAGPRLGGFGFGVGVQDLGLGFGT